MKLANIPFKIDIPLTCISDIAFLLLIFVILISLTGTKKYNIELPDSKSIIKEDNENSINITFIDDDILINNITTSGLKINIINELKKQDKKFIKIIAGKNLPFKKLKQALKILEQQKFNRIQFVVKR